MPNDFDDSFEELNKKAELLKHRLDQQLQAEDKKDIKRKPVETASSFHILGQLLGGVFVGTMLGIFIDQTLGTKPFALLFCLLLGLVAALRNLIKDTGKP